MTSTNDLTIAAYEQAISAYASGTPQSVNGEFEIWIDNNLVTLKPDAKIFEIGTATGRDADYIESRGFTVVRSDAAKAFVGLQQSEGHKAKLFNIVKDSFDQTYDMIFAAAVLLHLTPSETERAVQKIYDALVSQGRFVFSLKQGNGEEMTDRKLEVRRYFCYWKADVVKALLSTVGFDSIEITTIADARSKDKPDWLLINAVKGNKT